MDGQMKIKIFRAKKDTIRGWNLNEEHKEIKNLDFSSKFRNRNKQCKKCAEIFYLIFANIMIALQGIYMHTANNICEECAL